MSDTQPVLGVDMVVKDVDASVAFYRRLGLPITDAMKWRSHHVGVPVAGGGHFDLDSVELTRGYDPAWGDSGGVVLCFRVPTREAVDAAFAEVTSAGYEGHLPPLDAFWGARYAIVADPDGNRVAITSPVDPDRGGKPPI
jgi:catechol 2,3-dioxygenase-like lactoylglutathione lyase family enzyme